MEGVVEVVRNIYGIFVYLFEIERLFGEIFDLVRVLVNGIYSWVIELCVNFVVFLW